MVGAGATALAAVALSANHRALAQPVSGGPGFGHGFGGPGPMHGPGMGFGMGFFGPEADGDPAVAARRLDALVSLRLAVVDLTAEQRARISAVVQSLVKDLYGTREKMMKLRQESMELLGAATIDRARLEQLRVQQLQLADSSSKRLLTAVMDGAEVLTPAQRAKVMERPRRGWMDGRHERLPSAGDAPKK
ncbi:MAG TPA: periplasmic heavy metal sensor [Burkholderiaceae bacterium]|nr:periplasmic heavy metal sensor [Burkholderiaceae bacterium]